MPALNFPLPPAIPMPLGRSPISSNTKTALERKKAAEEAARKETEIAEKKHEKSELGKKITKTRNKLANALTTHTQQKQNVAITKRNLANIANTEDKTHLIKAHTEAVGKKKDTEARINEHQKLLKDLQSGGRRRRRRTRRKRRKTKHRRRKRHTKKRRHSRRKRRPRRR